MDRLTGDAAPLGSPRETSNVSLASTTSTVAQQTTPAWDNTHTVDDDRSLGCFGRQGRGRLNLSNYALSRELKRLHSARKMPFNPERQSHEQLLRMTWRALRDDPYVRSGEGWKEIGFQGNDPLTDVRAGGLLAMQCLAHFATTQTKGMRLMIKEIREAEQLHTSDPKAYPMRYYPVSTMSVVICAALCDALGISDGMRGPIPLAALAKLRASPQTYRNDLTPFLWSSYSSWMLGRRGGFFGLFSLLFSDFHSQFVAQGLGYMQSQELLATCIDRLKARAATARKVGTFAELRRLYVADEAAPPGIHVILHGREEAIRTLRAGRHALRLVQLNKAIGAGSSGSRGGSSSGGENSVGRAAKGGSSRLTLALSTKGKAASGVSEGIAIPPAPPVPQAETELPEPETLSALAARALAADADKV